MLFIPQFSDISVPRVHALGSVPVPHALCYVPLRHTHTSNALNKYQFMTHLFSKISSSTRAPFTTIIYVRDRPVRSAVRMSFRHFRKSLHHFLTYCTLTTPSSCTFFNYSWIPMMDARIRPQKEPNHTINFREGPCFRSDCRCTSIYPMNIAHFTPAPSVACRPLLQFLRRNRRLK